VTAVVGILAAGASTRMRGRDKLLEDVDGEPLLARQLGIAAALGLPILVAVPPGTGARQRITEAAGARQVTVADASRGMSASIAALASEAQRIEADALLLLLADMPELEVDDLRALMGAAQRSSDEIIRAGTESGRPGHPVVFPREYFDSLQRLQGDAGAREIIAAAPRVLIVRLPGERAVTDLDTPEAWAAWRGARSR
jgi:molybdenum cofactor cytidylyltransferase